MQQALCLICTLLRRKRTDTVQWKCSGLQIKGLTDTSLHQNEGWVFHLKHVNSDCPKPISAIQFNEVA